MLHEKSSYFIKWLKSNKLLLLTNFIIYQFGVLAIGIINYPYIDDIARQIEGKTDFARSYSRWGSEIGSWFIQGSRHLTDMGLTTHIITGSILSVASIIVVYCLCDKKITLLPIITSTLIGLNPWFLQCLSFRFDSPYMALSILFSVIPFLWWHKNKYNFFGISILSLFMMCNTYQSSSGIYIVMVLALSLKDLLAAKDFKLISNKILLAAISYILAMLAYVLETSFNPELASRGNTVAIAKMQDFPETIVMNSKMYLSKIAEQSNSLWILLCLILFVLFIFSSIMSSKISKLKSTLLVFLYLFFASILSYGVFLIFTEELAASHPRYAYGFSVFVVITLILLLNNRSPVFIRRTTQIFICLFCYYMLSFPFVYAATLNYQKEAFERQSIILATDLKDLVIDDSTTVHANTLFKNSPIYYNTSRNYPILENLVPQNSSIYWPNQMLFKTYTETKITIFPFNPKEIKTNSNDLVVDNY